MTIRQRCISGGRGVIPVERTETNEDIGGPAEGERFSLLDGITERQQSPLLRHPVIHMQQTARPPSV